MKQGKLELDSDFKTDDMLKTVIGGVVAIELIQIAKK